MFGIRQFQGTLDLMLLRMDGLERELYGLTRILWQYRREESEKWRTILQNQKEYDKAVADLTERVKAQTDVDSSALALISGLKAQINDLITRTDGIVDVSELQKLAASLDTGMRPLANAVTANTSPAPAPAPAPAPVADAPDAGKLPDDAPPSDGAAS